VFAYADDIESASVEVPTFAVKGVEAELTPRQVVVEMLSEATGVREGLTPDPVGLTGLVDAARASVRKLPAENREDMLVALLGRLTLLDLVRPSRDLLEHILSGLSSCLLVYRNTPRRPLVTICRMRTTPVRLPNLGEATRVGEPRAAAAIATALLLRDIRGTLPCHPGLDLRVVVSAHGLDRDSVHLCVAGPVDVRLLG
jgi:hypothetical protein